MVITDRQAGFQAGVDDVLAALEDVLGSWGWEGPCGCVRPGSAPAVTAPARAMPAATANAVVNPLLKAAGEA